MNSNPTVLLADYKILAGDLNELDLGIRCVINTVNQYSFIIAEHNTRFKTALQRSDILLPDGVGIVAAVKFLTGIEIKKIAGADMHDYLLNKLNKKGGRCFYLGSSEETLLLIKNRLNKEFHHVAVGTHSPPFSDSFSTDENKQIINIINEFKPDVLFVGMTAPKQEIWTHSYQSQLNANVICSIGAVFDFYAGTVNRPSEFWQNLWLEWFIRLVKEPRRMFKRYMLYGPEFVYLLLKLKIKKIRPHSKNDKSLYC